MRSDLVNIRMFVAAYEEGTFTAAAARENATQSGISQHISQLEHALGVTLFLRAKAGVLPTPAGQSFYAKSVDLLRLHHNAMKSTRLFGKGLSGDIKVGLMPTLTQAALAPSLIEFRQAHPNVRLLVVEAFSGALTETLLAGEIDFAITPIFDGRSGVQMLHFATVPEVFISPAGSQLSNHQPVILRDLAPMKLVVPSGANTRRRTIETYCATHGARIDQLFELDSVAGTLDFVANSDWQTILPMPAVINRLNDPRLTIHPIREPTLDLELVTIARANRGLPAAAEAFRDILAATVESINQQWSDIVEP